MSPSVRVEVWVKVLRMQLCYGLSEINIVYKPKAYEVGTAVIRTVRTATRPSIAGCLDVSTLWERLVTRETELATTDVR